ncbi:Regulator of G-protein signaling 8 [Xenoophorus captivus]|uniref:Regulator of G-protein signaling 8 n=1 Tax=Xenoophorus captivus TaxID=1517983 RepID=A0ABV0QNM3_9TELE
MRNLLGRLFTMKTRLGCLSKKSDSYSDFSEFLPPARETTARCLKLSTDEVVRWSESFDHLLAHKCKFVYIIFH